MEKCVYVIQHPWWNSVYVLFIISVVFGGRRSLGVKISFDAQRLTANTTDLHWRPGLQWQIQVHGVLMGAKINAHWTTGF